MKVQYRYEPFNLEDIVNGKTIKVPQFQRNVVWNKKKRKEFVDTLRAGNPFGSILVYQNKNKDYSLVDGLQRISTIKNYHTNPFEYYEYVDINADLVLELIKHYFEANGFVFEKESEAVKQKCIEIQKAIFERLKNKETASHISFALVNQFRLINDEMSFDLIQKIVDEFHNNLDISDLFVPAIVYTGPEEDLPNIFYNLNTGGVNLSKYETFSSLWDSQKYLVNDPEIIDKIYEKYDQLREKSDLEVDISKEEISNEGITLFEYCYSISEILRDKDKKYSLVLGTNKKSTDPVGFEIISLIMGLDVNKADKLGLKEMSDGKKGLLVGASPEFLVDLKNVIVNTFDVISDALEYWIKAENGKNNTLDSTYMIYHMAISYIKKNYIIDKKQLKITKTENKKWVDNYKKYLPLYYLKDYISDYWKKNRQVSDLTRLINNEDSLSKYANNIGMEEWDESLVEFRTNQLEEVGINLSLKANLFLDYLTKYKISKNPMLRKYFSSQNNYTIDYEHIVPQKKFEDKFDSKNKVKGYPVSSIGNICYLASTDNRSKHDKTIYEHVKDRPSFVISDEYIDLIDYPTRDDLRFIDYDKDKFDIEYRKFIEARTDELIEEFKDLVKELY